MYPSRMMNLIVAILAFVTIFCFTYGHLIKSQRIMGGSAADMTTFSFQLSLRYENVHQCGAVLISAQTALTAAHCLYNDYNLAIQVEDLSVFGGSAYLDQGTGVNLRSVVKHSGYLPNKPFDDIAVLILQDVIGNNMVSPIALPTPNAVIEAGSKANVSGWGSLELYGDMSNLLHYVEIEVVDDNVCVDIYSTITPVTDDMVCAGSSEDGKDACYGDSGGPLTQNGMLIGIVSWGRKCGSAKYPGVYTRVDKYLDFIDSHII
ncbi:hypothetical protein PPYR_05737 [Photinus pyralis]|uniref:Peptidase S1 domain-containing protein n=2 Tax=Photinus pyralis TaxID=7054 RepID=A0A5N4AVU7_PHOPY|nr:hypothetical protein PPYR_05737 [Photinus pyralis]